ncbi:bifunctional phosphopantothenoylcysteine decarboxylase/phosphopantothenate--cysteine ligase CoaBC [Aliikangiella sp. G2MR2-5]|uniref:bifunctional phosphopantothenoylcysteine decarboxylase/phosphopantothenate--cysteine ligase CoaBC n=1 Tax=Aliikangiella sp. G2MR2-5 TaxID=2788943 RepID=UPI001AED5BD7|nr:bifunctional phosphopantothenoylcysteine decarboxylase/phosphopantothenate--cysteine ligase CoaBC [Aliikangiella sp. G2MR2-5]
MSNNNSSQQITRIVLGITGGIAAYKCPDLVRRLKERQFDVRVVMTAAAKEFVTPMALQAVSGFPVHDELFDPEAEAAMGHIDLAKWADIFLIAPASANTLAKLAHGEADNLLTTSVLASKARLIIAPAMNQQMWANEKTQRNIRALETGGALILGPGVGEQACGDVGAGRMLEPLDIAERVESLNEVSGVLAGKRVMITAGPTVEAIDPVRYISNHSSGKMGYALARAAIAAGAEVDLVSGPVNIHTPAGANIFPVKSAKEMLEVVQNRVSDCDIFIGCAAVADYSPVDVSSQKIKKNDEVMTLKLKRNPDILAWVAAQKVRPFVVGFAAESEKLKFYAEKKLNNKKLNMICANDISCEGLGFNSDNNQLLILDDKGQEKNLQIAAKEVLAADIIKEISYRLG